MTATITGDYSKYPASIREVFPCLAGEVCDLRQAWEVYSHLFMEEKDLTDAMAERLGGVLGMFQSMLQDEMFLSIARLTDRDSRMQANLSLWSLLAAIPDAHDAGFDQNVRSALDRVCAAAAGVRKHRHKRIAHFDLRVSLSSAILPVVTFKEIREVLEQIESFLTYSIGSSRKRRCFSIAYRLATSLTRQKPLPTKRELMMLSKLRVRFPNWSGDGERRDEQSPTTACSGWEPAVHLSATPVSAAAGSHR
jgi:hypothetical protein